MPQLTMITSGSKFSLNFRWPYQAKVMNTLEANSIRTGKTCGEMVGIDILSKSLRLTYRRGTRFHPPSISFDPTDRKAGRVRSPTFKASNKKTRRDCNYPSHWAT